VADLAFGCDLAQGKAVDAVCINKLNACFYKLTPQISVVVGFIFHFLQPSFRYLNAVKIVALNLYDVKID
jgi:hypothetical protein